MTGSLTRRAATVLDVRAVAVFYLLETKIIRLAVIRSESRENFISLQGVLYFAELVSAWSNHISPERTR